MGQQSGRQAARRAALRMQAERRSARAGRERRLDQLAVDVHTALGERDAAAAAAERRAGEALHAMTREGGLTLRAVVEWCGGGLTLREAVRLRTLAEGVPSSAETENVAEAQRSNKR